MQDEDIIREFLVESHENLSRLDQELVELEKHPKDAELLASIFRTMHTIKGTCGFLAFSTLERISHQAETLLSQLRDGRRDLSPPLVSLILDTVDATRKVLGSIEASGEEGPERFEGLTERLRLAALLTPFAAEEKPVPVLTPPPAAEEKPVPVLKPPPAAEDKPMPVLKPPPTAAEEKPVPVLTPPPAAEEKPVPVLKPPPAAEDKPMPVLKPPPTAAEDRPMPVSTPPLVEAPVAAVEHPDSAAAEHAEDKPRESELTKSSAVADSNIRVGVGLLDKLMDLVGELVLTRNQILQFNTEREDAALNVTSQRLNLITTELQEGVMKTRMQPIGMVWNKLPRVVRDIATSLGKQILLEMDGAETELDRTIIEAIKDPLVHLVRNSCDHGVETPEIRVRMGKPPQGTLSLRAYHEGGQVNIEIADDGAGIDVAQVKQKAIEKGLLGPEQAAKLTDREALGMVFLPGFSTAKKVTNVSGRGVGMDVVKSNIEKIGGIVDIFSRPGEGTTVKLKIPLTLVIIPGLVISSGGERFVIPQVSLLELIRLEGDSGEKRIERVHGTPVYRRRGTLLPIAYLNQVLGLESPGQTDVVSMVVLQAEDRQFGLVVDGINDTQEIVVKPLSKQLKGLTIYAGATIMGDGHVALILDVLGIGQRSGVMAESREQSRASVEKKTEAGMEQQRLLLFRAGSFERLAIPLSLVARLEEFPQSSIEHAGGSQVVQYRNRILPLIPLRDVLDSGTPAQGQPADPVQVIVFNDGDRSVGLMVDQILDVAEETVTVRQKSGRKGLLGSAVVGKRVADFLDLNQVIRVAAADWLQPAGASSAGKRILVAEASAFSRGLIRSGLDMAGYQVLEAANLDEALRSLERHPVDIVVTSLDLPPNGSSALLAAMRSRTEWQRVPVLALADSAEQVQARAGQVVDFQDCQVKFDREAMLGSLARLASAVASSSAALVCVGEER